MTNVCHICNGSGKNGQEVQGENGVTVVAVPCWNCGGDGKGYAELINDVPPTAEEQAREDQLNRTINQIEEECAAAVKAWMSRDVNTPELKRRIYQTIQLEYLRRDVCIATAIWQADCELTSAQEICEILATIGGEFLKNAIRLIEDRPLELRGHIVRQLLAGYVKELVKDGLIPAAPPQQATPPILGADGKPIRRKMH